MKLWYFDLFLAFAMISLTIMVILNLQVFKQLLEML